MASKGYDYSKYFLLLTAVAIYYAVSFPIKNSTKYSLGYPTDSLLNFTELATRYGYLTEEHTVVTDDGYVLTVFRIVKGRECRGKRLSPPVLLMHGLLESADVWLSAGPDAGLAYLISDSCFDIWIGNCRGNNYGRNHLTLNADRDKEFWQFSVDEIGLYDVPAMVDYILKHTNVDKLNYIGFSQGAGTFFIMCSERPGYCDKANVMIALAPATRQLHTKSVPYRLLTQVISHAADFIRFLGVEEMFAKGSPSQELLAFFCHSSVTSKVCNIVQALIDSYHSGSIGNVTASNMYGHFPAGTSLQNMARYGQSMTSKDFVKFDYGAKKNLQVYGSGQPPKYDLGAVTAPVLVLFGKNDGLVDPKDIKWLVNKLPNVLDVVAVKDPLWNHLDMPYSQFGGQFIFPTVHEYLLEYSS